LLANTFKKYWQYQYQYNWFTFYLLIQKRKLTDAADVWHVVTRSQCVLLIVFIQTISITMSTGPPHNRVKQMVLSFAKLDAFSIQAALNLFSW